MLQSRFVDLLLVTLRTEALFGLHCWPRNLIAAISHGLAKTYAPHLNGPIHGRLCLCGSRAPLLWECCSLLCINEDTSATEEGHQLSGSQPSNYSNHYFSSILSNTLSLYSLIILSGRFRMYFTKSSIVSFSLLASSSLVAGHGAIIGATGDAGGQGSAIGVVPTTPRDGTGRNPFQQDSTRFRGDAAASCGETLGGGDNDIQAGTAQVMALNGPTLPQVSAGGQIMMTVHQVNSDGAGPYTCMIDATGTGTNWQPITVTQNLEGSARGRNRDTQMQDLPLTAAIPAGQTCTGTVAGQSNVCMVRCENPARAGPFGGCVPVQMAGATAAAPGKFT